VNDMTWDYYNIEKADFSFRSIIRNSRGVYAGIFDKIQITPDLSKYAGDVLGEAAKAVEDYELSMFNKTKIMELVLSEPLLMAIDMMNDPKYEDEIDSIRAKPVSSFNDKDDEAEVDENEIDEKTITALNKVSQEIANNVREEMRRTISDKLEDAISSSAATSLDEIDDSVIKLLSTPEFSRYTSIVTSALIKKMSLESTAMSLESENEVEVNPDEDFPPSFFERERTMKSWFDNVKR
jgi:hypothetical protein